MEKIKQTKKRHGFVTFWLYFGLVANIIGIIASVVSYQNLTNLGYTGMQLITSGVDITPFSEAIHPHVLVLQVVAVISGILMIVGYAMLLNWKKAGFWIITVTAIITAIIIVIMMGYIKQDYALVGLTINWNPVTQLVVTPVSVFILWAILQLKKERISCWQQLESTINAR